MIELRYDSKKLWQGLLIFQGFPLICLAMFVGVLSGQLSLRPGNGIYFVIAVGVAVYILVLTFFIHHIRYPVLLYLNYNGLMKWRPFFKEYVFQVPPGTQVTIDQRSIRVSPAIPALRGSETKDDLTSARLPKGLQEFRNAQLRIE